jgi:hypothetical protein
MPPAVATTDIILHSTSVRVLSPSQYSLCHLCGTRQSSLSFQTKFLFENRIDEAGIIAVKWIMVRGGAGPRPNRRIPFQIKEPYGIFITFDSPNGPSNNLRGLYATS